MYIARHLYYVHGNFVDVGVNFNRSIHYISEQDESVLLTVVLTEPLNSTEVTVYIEESGDSKSPNGKCVLPDIVNVRNHCKTVFL